MFQGLHEKLVFLGPKLQGPAIDSVGFFKEVLKSEALWKASSTDCIKLVVYLEANVDSLENELSSLVKVYQASHSTANGKGKDASTAKVNSKNDHTGSVRPKVAQLLQELSQLPSLLPSSPTPSLASPSTTSSLSSSSPWIRSISIDQAGISGTRQKADWANAIRSEDSSSSTNAEGYVQTLSISPIVKKRPQDIWISSALSFWSGNSDTDSIPEDTHPISLLYNKVITSKAHADTYHSFASVAMYRISVAFRQQVEWTRYTKDKKESLIEYLTANVLKDQRNHDPETIKGVLSDLLQKGPKWNEWADSLGGVGALFFRHPLLNRTMVEHVMTKDERTRATAILRSRDIEKFARLYNNAANTILDAIALPFKNKGTSQKRKTLLEPRCHLLTKRAKVDKNRNLSRVEVESTEHDVIDRNSVSEIMVATVRIDQLTTPHQSSSQGRAPPDQSMVPGSASFGGPHDQYSCTDLPVNTGTSMGPRTSVDPSPVGVDIFADMLEPTEGVPFSFPDLSVNQPASHDPYGSTDFSASTGTFTGPRTGVDPSSVGVNIFDVLEPTAGVPYSFPDLNAHQPASHNPYGSIDFPASTEAFTGPQTSVDPSPVGVNIFDVLVPTEDVPYSNTYSSADPQQSVGPSPYNFTGPPADSGTFNGAHSTGDPSTIRLERQSPQPVTNHLYLCHIVNTEYFNNENNKPEAPQT